MKTENNLEMEDGVEVESVPLAPGPNEAPATLPVSTDADTVYFLRRTWRPALTVGAIRLATVKHGVTLTAEDFSSGDLGVMARLCWVACLRERPTMTEDEYLTGILAEHPDEEKKLFAIVRADLREMNLASDNEGDETGGEDDEDAEGKSQVAAADPG